MADEDGEGEAAIPVSEPAKKASRRRRAMAAAKHKYKLVKAELQKLREDRFGEAHCPEHQLFEVGGCHVVTHTHTLHTPHTHTWRAVAHHASG